jgi:hypothetical protein
MLPQALSARLQQVQGMLVALGQWWGCTLQQFEDLQLRGLGGGAVGDSARLRCLGSAVALNTAETFRHHEESPTGQQQDLAMPPLL